MTLASANAGSAQYFYTNESEAALGMFRQSSLATTQFFVDYSNWLLPSEVIVSALGFVVANTTPLLQVGSFYLVNSEDGTAQGISFLVSGGVAGTDYEVLIQANTSLRQVKVDVLVVHVKAWPNVGTFVPPPFQPTALPLIPPTGGGLLWNNGGLVAITSGTADPAAPSWVLLLPTSPTGLGAGYLWNDGGILAIASYGSSSNSPAWTASLAQVLPPIAGQVWSDGLAIAIS